MHHARRLMSMALALALAAGSAPTLAQTSIDPLDVHGRHFAGVRFAQAPISGDVTLRASRAWVWDESDDAGALTRRVMLEGDVQVQAGGYDFRASRAAVWLERVGENAWQLYAFMEGVSTPRADPSLGVTARTLGVQGVLRSQAAPRLIAPVVTNERPKDGFVRLAERELAVVLRNALGLPTLDAGAAPGPRSGAGALTPEEVAAMLAALPGEEAQRPIFEAQGTVSFSAGDVAAVEDGDESAVLLTGGVSVLYEGRASGSEATPSLHMKAQRAVVFLPKDALRQGSIAGLDSGSVRGIYLEGEVMASDGEYTVRGPSVFYDVQADRALVLDGVFYAFDPQRQLPLYVRAQAVRQESADSWRAENVRIANTGFARPALSLGASSLALVRRAAPGQQGADFTLTAKNATLRVGDVPVLWLPAYSGDPSNRPLRSISVDSAGGGVAIKTTWNLFSVLGLPRQNGLEVDLLLDGHFERGLGLGTELRWNRPDLRGNLLTYGLIADQGEDRLRTGRDLGHDSEFRGMVLLEQRHTLNPLYTLWIDGAYVSDETFIDGLFDPLQYERRPLTTGGFLRRRDGNSQFSIEARGTLNDFISSDYALQSPGYLTEKLPEVAYSRVADDLVPSMRPGLISWTHEYRASRMELAFSEPTARELGFDTPSLAERALGIDPDTSLADRFRAMGYLQSPLLRGDTRQELSARFEAGPFSVVPTLAGRATYWDDSFDTFSPDEDDQTRLWGGAGVRIGTSIARVYDGVDSRALDLHRLRHVIEPSLTLWRGWTSIDASDIPVYDFDVEPLLEGDVVRLAVDQTFSTQRGGYGRWRSVDVLTLSGELVWSTDNNGSAPIGRYYDFRPELSRPGDFAGLDSALRISDGLAFTSSLIFDLDENRSSRSSLGLLIDHSPLTSTSIEYRTIDPVDASYLDLVNAYQLGDKYLLNSFISYDLDESDVRRVGTQVRREFPAIIVGLGVSYDNIEGTTSFGFEISPKGFGRGVRFRGVGAGEANAGG